MDLTTALFDLSAHEAARKLAADFGIAERRPSVPAKAESLQDTGRQSTALLSGPSGVSAYPAGPEREVCTPEDELHPHLWKPAICSNARSICWIC